MSNRLLMLLALLPGLAFAANEDLQNLPDPTRPVLQDYTGAPNAGSGLLSALLSGAPSYQLSSVLIREQSRMAVINGQRVQVGDSVDGARVRAIDATGVVLDHNGERIALELYANPIKTLVNDDGQ